MGQDYTTTRASLILRLKRSEDIAAWDEFATMYSPVILRVALSRGLQTADAENLVQEVLLAVSQSVTNWLDRKDRGSFRAWLLTIAKNKSVDILTKRATRQLGHDGSTAERIFADLPAHEDLSKALDLEYERVVFHKASEQVRTAVADRTWEAFWLTAINGLPITEVAQRLETRPGNIYVSRSRVMARIKRIVAEYEAQE